MSRDRLDKLLGMLGSDFEGERASAALMIAKMAMASGGTIVQLVESTYGGTRAKVREVKDAHRTTRSYKPVRTSENMPHWATKAKPDALVERLRVLRDDEEKFGRLNSGVQVYIDNVISGGEVHRTAIGTVERILRQTGF